MPERQMLIAAHALLEKAVPLIEDGGWPAIAVEVAALADAVDAAIPTETDATD
jgi:hypothetical protein